MATEIDYMPVLSPFGQSVLREEGLILQRCPGCNALRLHVESCAHEDWPSYYTEANRRRSHRA